jgi:toxin ParE1/3/4
MLGVQRRAAARRDLVDLYVYYAEAGGEALADRFLQSVEVSCTMLQEQPLIGSPLNLRHAALRDVRRWPVRDFQDVLIFYRPHAEGVELIRVLYASRDWWTLLGFG